MIAGIFHEGSGLGDQLFRYITVRTLAEEKGWGFGMCNYDSFKGMDFMKIDTGIPIGSPEAMLYSDNKLKGMYKWLEKDVRDSSGNDIRSYDPEINFIKDYTFIDGSFEDSKYWGHNLFKIDQWLSVESPYGYIETIGYPSTRKGMNGPDDLCILGFRGGEYYTNPNLGLSREYYDEAIKKMLVINPQMRFQVHTDDPMLAKQFFPEFEIVENTAISHSKHSNMSFNWRSARYAKYAIIPNSAFFIIPRLLKHLEDPTAVTIAPRYWARRNTKTWARPACYYKQFTYI